MPFCAIPPVDMASSHVGRGFGIGWNRTHTRMDQKHGGMDFTVSAGSPIIASVAGRVVRIGSDANRTVASAGGLRGYGNAVVIETRGAIPGMPNPFYTLYAHMRAAPLVSVGQAVQAGTPLGFVGNTNNGQFPGMGSHLHYEQRRRAFPSSYDNDTIDPAIFWQGVGIDWIGNHADAGRRTGGTLQIRAGGPSDCRAGGASSLGIVYGSFTSGQAGPGEQYIPPSALSPNYPGTTALGPEVEPPPYGGETSTPSTSSSSSGAGLAWAAAGVLALVALAKR